MLIFQNSNLFKTLIDYLRRLASVVHCITYSMTQARWFYPFHIHLFSKLKPLWIFIPKIFTEFYQSSDRLNYTWQKGNMILLLSYSSFSTSSHFVTLYDHLHITASAVRCIKCRMTLRSTVILISLSSFSKFQLL